MAYLGAYYGAKAVLCIDNDSAGEAFKADIDYAGIKYIDRSPDEQYKDWNEQLVAQKGNCNPIQRLMKRNAAVGKSAR